MPTRLALVDDHPALLKWLAAIFAADPSFEVVATGGNAAEAVTIVQDRTPDLLIVDLSMPGDVFAAIGEMARTAPLLKLIVFTAFSNVDMALRAMDAGAHAFVLKGRPTNDLFDAVEAVLRGDIYISPEFSPRLISGFKNRERRDSTAITLTTREEQLVQGLLEARTHAEMATSLGMTEKMIQHYMSGLMMKLNVHSRLEIIEAVRQLRSEGP